MNFIKNVHFCLLLGKLYFGPILSLLKKISEKIVSADFIKQPPLVLFDINTMLLIAFVVQMKVTSTVLLYWIQSMIPVVTVL